MSFGGGLGVYIGGRDGINVNICKYIPPGCIKRSLSKSAHGK